MPRAKTVILPDAEEMMRRLTGVVDDPHLIRRFYPTVVKGFAGRKQSGIGIVTGLRYLISLYAQDFPVVRVLNASVEVYALCLVDDPEVRADIRAAIE